jgi:hypothetical protein
MADMIDPQGRELLERMRSAYRQPERDVPALVEMLKEFRQYGLKAENPLVTKVSRLAYEHLEANGDFLVRYVDEDLESEVSNFEYLLQLLADPANKYNREDLQAFRDYLLAYPEVPVLPEEQE